MSVGENMSQEEWATMRSEESDSFYFWSLVKTVGMLNLIILRATRSSDFLMFCRALEYSIPFIIMLDHSKYHKWLTVFIDDMRQLIHSNKDLYEKFIRGNFFVSYGRVFSTINIDQAHEHTNRIIKEFHGALGSDIEQLWNIGCPGLIDFISQFEDSDRPAEHSSSRHDDITSVTKRFIGDVQKVSGALERLNPFEANNLFYINNGNQMSYSTDDMYRLKCIFEIGSDLYSQFRKERLIECTKDFNAVLKRQNLWLPGKSPSKKSGGVVSGLTTTKEQQMIQELKAVIPIRETAVKDALRCEFDNIPPCFTINGESYSGSKSSMLKKFKHSTIQYNPANYKCMVIDLTFLTVQLAHGKHTNFLSLFNQIGEAVLRLRGTMDLVHLVTDNYENDNIIKAVTSKKRGTSGTALVFDINTKFPANFRDNFLRCRSNKLALFDLLTDYLLELASGWDFRLAVTKRNKVYGNYEVNMPTSSHQEADTRIVLHILHCLRFQNQIVVRVNDTDVLVILTYYYKQFKSLNSDLKLHVFMGTGDNTRIYDVASLVKQINGEQDVSSGPSKVDGLLLMYAMSGCDYVESFYRIGKATFFDRYTRFKENDDLFTILNQLTTVPSQSYLRANFQDIAQFILSLYGFKGNDCLEARFSMLKTETIVTIRSLPPSQQSLYLHLLRAVYVAGKVWGQATIHNPEMGNITDWGWKFSNDDLIPQWTMMVYDRDNKDTNPYAKATMKCKCRPSKKKKLCQVEKEDSKKKDSKKKDSKKKDSKKEDSKKKKKGCSCKRNKLQCWEGQCACNNKCELEQD